jgi:hypothetical protein
LQDGGELAAVISPIGGEQEAAFRLVGGSGH